MEKFKDQTEIPNIKHSVTIKILSGIKVKTSQGEELDLPSDSTDVKFTNSFSFSTDGKRIYNVKSD